MELSLNLKKTRPFFSHSFTQLDVEEMYFSSQVNCIFNGIAHIHMYWEYWTNVFYRTLYMLLDWKGTAISKINKNADDNLYSSCPAVSKMSYQMKYKYY